MLFDVISRAALMLALMLAAMFVITIAAGFLLPLGPSDCFTESLSGDHSAQYRTCMERVAAHNAWASREAAENLWYFGLPTTLVAILLFFSRSILMAVRSRKLARL